MKNTIGRKVLKESHQNKGRKRENLNKEASH